MLKNIYVLYGGISVEHEVSIRSGKTIINQLDRSKYIVHPVYIDKKGVWHCLGITEPGVSEEDLVKESDDSIPESIANFLQKDYDPTKENIFFPILHGTNGEDGVIQGFFKTLNVPFTGTGVLGAALTMDKGTANDILEAHGISQAKYIVIDRHNLDSLEEVNVDDVVEKLGLPLYVKPCNAGSSVGITPVQKKEELISALEHAFKYDPRVVLEEEILGVELEVTVLGNNKARSSIAGSYVNTDPFLDYEQKYHDSKVIAQIPYELEEGKLNELQELAERTYKACCCTGFARVDIFMRDTDKALLVNEINTLPGMTPTSMAQKLWEATYGDDYPKFLELLIDLAIERYQEENQLFKDRG